MISFGPPGDRTASEIYLAFGKWLDLYTKFPQKVLFFKSPYEAIEKLVNPTNIVTIEQLIQHYRSWVKKNETIDILYRTERVSRFLEPYSDWLIHSFAAEELKDIQKAMQDYSYGKSKQKKKYTRQRINRNIKHILSIWHWGVGRNYVTPAQAKQLDEIKSLRIGQAIENSKREKVTDEEFEKVLKKVNSVVGDMLHLIWYTAMRPGEVCNMRPYDLLTDDPECWLYIPGRDEGPVGKHKTMRFGRTKAIPLTAQSQDLLQNKISDFNSKEYIFKPTDALKEMHEVRKKIRKTPLKYGNSPGTNKKEHPMIQPGEKYTVSALRIACRRGCARAGVEPFKPL